MSLLFAFGGMMGNHFFIVIAGNIASGKTTLAKKLSKKLRIRMYEEPVRDNPFLPAFYKWLKLMECNPHDKNIRRLAQKASYQLQEFYLINRVRDHKKILSYDEPIIQDRSIYEDKEIFTKNSYKKGLMRVGDYLKYKILYFLLTRKLKKPDLLIFLSAPVRTLKQRLRKRNNPYEKELTQSKNMYLQELDKRYRKLFFSYKGPKMIVNSGKLNFEKGGKNLDRIAEKVRELLDG